jgi:SpoVK/Ycf46/Vps4 family AAA+-type ATPase
MKPEGDATALPQKAPATTVPEITPDPADTPPPLEKTTARASKSKQSDARLAAAIARLHTMTASQRQAALELRARAEALFFNDPPQELGIPQQLNSLMIGPTGYGKSTVVENLADLVRAGCVTCTYGSWIPAGAHESNTPTLRAVTQALARYERVVVFVDELDKFFGAQEPSSWHSSVLNDLWMLLDRRPVLKREHLADVRSAQSVEELADMFRRRVFIVAAGTWQELFKDKRSVGFACAAQKDDPVETIFRKGLLPDEIRRRFHARVIPLNYPTVEEIKRMIEADEWLRDRLQELGHSPNYEQIWREVQQVGLTALTTYKTEMVLDACARTEPVGIHR